MLGKRIYKAKIIEGKVEMLSFKIVRATRNIYTLDRRYRGYLTLRKDDVGVVVFLTAKGAMDYLIKELEHFVELGESYLKKTKEQLAEALGYKF